MIKTPSMRYALTLVLAVCSLIVNAQTGGVSLKGKIVDRDSGQPVPYATVAVKSNPDHRIFAGATTDENGTFFFEVPRRDSLYIEISFLGFRPRTFPFPGPDKNHVDLGEIQLEQDRETLDEVEVTAEKSRTEFKLDKRVFNVGKDISSTGMGAMEVLNNVPSVNVDIEGQVSLRGRSGVQILINGKPSVVSDDPSKALSNITADMIDRVEVITNPSAKYDAEGTAGILNVVLKKDEKRGLNGSITLNTGIPANHSVGVSLNRRTDKFNFFTQLGAGYRSIPSHNETVNRNKLNDTTLTSQGTNYRNETFYNITLGTDYHLSDKDVITLSGNYAFEDEDQPSETEFRQYDGQDVLTRAWNRTETTSATNPKWKYDLQYKRDFADDEDHDLIVSALGHFFGKDLNSEFVNRSAADDLVTGRQRTRTAFDQADFTFKLDYTKPFNDTYTLETGAQYHIQDVGNDYEVSDDVDGQWVVDPNFTNDFAYDQKVMAAYATGAYELDKWGLKLGLRAENTDLRTSLANTGEDNRRTYTDLFPSAHSSYKFNDQYSVQAGYSRRIYRPRLWHLNPFFSIRDNYNIRTGNPELQPEYTDSYELTGIFLLGKASFNAGLYHLGTTDVMEYVSRVDGSVTTTMPMNIGKEATTGLEINGKYTPGKVVSFTGDFNYGQFVRKGNFQGQSFDFSGDKWTSKLTAKLSLPADIELELTGNYNSKYRTLQGERAGYGSMDAGARKKLWGGKGVINLSVRDVFASRVWETTIDEPAYYLYSSRSRGRFVTLGFSYGFGKGEAMTYSGRGYY